MQFYYGWILPLNDGTELILFSAEQVKVNKKQRQREEN